MTDIRPCDHHVMTGGHRLAGGNNARAHRLANRIEDAVLLAMGALLLLDQLESVDGPVRG